MSHDPAEQVRRFQTAKPPENGQPGSLRSGVWFASEKAAHAWVRKLDQMDNEQLADVLGFIFCKLCKR